MGLTWYQDSLRQTFKSDFKPENGDGFDVVIVGGGLAGLTLLHFLAEAGIESLLIDSDEIGMGASGRNGGFCSPGWSQGYEELLKSYNLKVVRELDHISSQGLAWMKEKCTEGNFNSVEYKEGIVSCFLTGNAASAEKVINKNNKIFETDHKFLPKDELEKIIVCNRYLFGVKLDEGFHFHPLNFMKSLAKECVKKGGKVSEKCTLVNYRKHQAKYNLKIDLGGEIQNISCEKIVFATGGYAGREIGNLRRYWLPILTFMGVTEPLEKKLFDIFIQNYGISDNRRAGNYYRIVDRNRISWGRGISALGDISVSTIKQQVAKDINFFFPELGLLNIDYAWSGKMAYARHLMPYVGLVNTGKKNGIYALTGFGGHGMNTAPGCAMVLAEHLISGSKSYTAFDVFERSWNGGLFGPYAAEAKYIYLKMWDYLEQIYNKG